MELKDNNDAIKEVPKDEVPMNTPSTSGVQNKTVFPNAQKVEQYENITMDDTSELSMSYVQQRFNQTVSHSLFTHSLVVPGTPDIRKRIRMYFPLVPIVNHFLAADGEIYVRVPAVQISTGAFCIIEVPSSIGVINNLWDQLPGYRLYDTAISQPPVEMNLARSGSIVELSTVVFQHDPTV